MFVFCLHCHWAYADTAEIKFSEFYKMPVGEKGLEPTQKLINLHGKKVRLIGYMVKSDEAQVGMYILSPLPASLGEADESLSNDLPLSVVFIHFKDTARITPYVAGLVQVVGMLELGAKQEPDGHVSQVRVLLD